MVCAATPRYGIFYLSVSLYKHIDHDTHKGLLIRHCYVAACMHS